MAPRGRQQRALSALRRHLRPVEDGMLLAASPAGGSACSSPSSGSSDGSALFRPGFRFDRVAWERDGYLVLPDVLTDEARERWLSTLQRLQRLQDEITLRTDWNDGAAWASLGLRPREPRATAADCERIAGGSEQGSMSLFPAGFGELPLADRLRAPITCGFQFQGCLPEYFPAAHDPWLMDVTTEHPEWMALQRELLRPMGAPPDQPLRPVRYDHSVMLNRTARGPDSGRRWHAHPMDARDSPRTNAPGEEFFDAARMVEPELTLTRTLVYPNGIKEEDGGLLGLIPGAHHFRGEYYDTSSLLLLLVQSISVDLF